MSERELKSLTDEQIDALWEQTFAKSLPLPASAGIRATVRRRMFARAVAAVIAERQAVPETLRQALAELVACKDLKDERCASSGISVTEHAKNYDRWLKRQAEYRRRQPLAWERARAALSSAVPGDRDALRRVLASLPAESPAPEVPMLSEDDFIGLAQKAGYRVSTRHERRIAIEFARAILAASPKPPAPPATDTKDSATDSRGDPAQPFGKE